MLNYCFDTVMCLEYLWKSTEMEYSFKNSFIALLPSVAL